MSTTTIFAELLVIGVQCTVWMALLMLNILGYNWISKFDINYKDWVAIIVLFSMAMFYTFGMMADRVFDATSKVLNPTKFLLPIRWVNNKGKSLLSIERIEVELFTGNLSNYYQYIITRLRIARATFFNSLLILSMTLLI